MLTDIQRIAKGSVFSNLSNPLVCTVKDKECAEYFEFKKAGVEQILHVYGYEYNTEIQDVQALPARGVTDTVQEELLSTAPGPLSTMLTRED